MDNLKNVSFSIVLFIIGAIFIFLGLSGGFTVNNYSLIIQEPWAKTVSTIIGVILMGIAVYLEVSSKTLIKKSSTPGDKKTKAEDFFYTLDDKLAESFPNMVEGAVRVQIFGRTVVNIVGQYEKVFEQIGKNGCEIQLLFVDPSSETAQFLYGSNPEVYKNNIISASQHLKRMKATIGDRLQLRVTKHAPTISVIAIEKQDVQQNFVQAQLYFLHSALGRDRPIFRVGHSDKWYKIFRDEFTLLWSDSAEWDMNRFLEKADS